MKKERSFFLLLLFVFLIVAHNNMGKGGRPKIEKGRGKSLHNILVLLHQNTFFHLFSPASMLHRTINTVGLFQLIIFIINNFKIIQIRNCYFEFEFKLLVPLELVPQFTTVFVCLSDSQS